MASRKITKTLRWMLILFLLVGVIGLGTILGYEYTRRQASRIARFEAMEAAKNATAPTDANGDPLPTDPVETFPDQNTEGAKMIYVDLGDSTAKIADKLYKEGLITNKSVFTLMSKVNGFDGSYKSGTHYLMKNMSLDEMMYILTMQPKSVRVTIVEGTNYWQLKELLKENGIVINEEVMDALVNDPNPFLNYPFIKDLDLDGSRTVALEGYLFPDTYFFDVNSSEDKILTTMFDNLNSRLTEDYYDRAAEIGMTMDQVFRLASIIEKESTVLEDMYKISRVFHNRLNQQMKLESCATVNYVRQLNGKPPILIVKQDDLKMESPYNTYLYTDLPPGPICNPGLEAIRAALYPDTSEPDLMYFAARGDGTTVFARTFEEHLDNVAKYVKPLEDRLISERGGSEGADWVDLPQVNTADIEIPEISDIQTP
ncbi:MAG: endolytic transglycosylase MltG [Eubacteriales bacterium]|nr:endolytic transglycosylase MltG [Eubacteriales bacterium]